MTYTLQHYGYPPGGPHSFVARWYDCETFEDKELADKELANLLRRWPKAEYRIIYNPD